MKIFAIETSCDETAAAIVEDGTKLLSSTIATSKELHEKTGGIIPEVAARKQVESIVPVIEETIKNPKLKMEDIDAFAVTTGPGLIGSLVVGVAAAKSLAFIYKKPLVPVNHLIGHIYANWVESSKLPEFPALALVISGGHTDLVLMHRHGDFKYLGGTLDDAAGEAFDKTARLLGLKKYLGGAELSGLAALCEKNLFEGKLPRPKMRDDDFDFSFSGLKTAVKRLIEGDKSFSGESTEFIQSVAREFENAVGDVVSSKILKAINKYNVKSLVIGGGVAANINLRERLEKDVRGINVSLHIPPMKYCTDNAVYIASAAYFINKPVELEEIDANPALGIMD
ncbi:tRNA (adenosine(37)-N6)-threonylcarbamoyltransferase complex transferase subunit TsaD [candidate division WWE3 bacterium]|nr:tRNA (adenosine(37)-N6)-threonylcarbamoyltransferase complex transferase subunit TsaD [candidate division WWE3 bacterium]